MNFRLYIKNSLWKIAYFLLLVFIINTLLLLSPSISEAIYDIIYMNILMASLSLAFFIGGYFRWKNLYRDYKAALDNKINLSNVLPKGNAFEAKLIKATVINKNKELQEKTLELNSLLEELNDYITQWIHEIKIPISVCELISDRLGEASNIKDLGQASEDLKMELERIKFLIDQVLYGSRASNYSKDLSMEEVSLEKIVKSTVKKNSSFFISKKISVSLSNLSYNVITDKKWISYMLQQLLNNSYKYVNINGKIDIYAIEDARSIRLHVRDNGIGIQSKDINRIFDKGFTGDNGRKTAKSTGMGLYFSKKMIDELGHSISVASKPNDYTEFTIVFYKLSDYLNITKL